MSLGAVGHQYTRKTSHDDKPNAGNEDSDESDTVLIISDEEDSDVEHTEATPIRATHEQPNDENISKIKDKWFHDNFKDRLHVQFRRVKNDELVLIGQRFPLVDMQVDKEIEERMITGKKLTDVYQGKRAVTFIWNELNTSSSLTLTKLHFTVFNVDDSFHRTLYTGMVRSDFAVCRDFVSKVYRNFRSKVVSVVPGNMSFEVLHDCDISFGTMKGQNESEKVIVDMYKELLVTCTNMAVEVKLEIEAPGSVFEWTKLMEGESRKSVERLEFRERTQRRCITKLATGTSERIPDLYSSSDTDSEELTMIDDLEAEQVELNKLLDSISECLSPRTQESLSTRTQESVISTEEASQADALASSFDTNALFESEQWTRVTGRQTEPCVHSDQISSRKVLLSHTVDQKQQNSQSNSTFLSSLETTPKELYTRSESSDMHLSEASYHQLSDTPTNGTPTHSLQMATSLPMSQGVPGVDDMMKLIGAFGMSDDVRVQRLPKAIERNLIDEDPVPPRADAHDTVLCLDTSQSMEGQAFADMKRMALNFVDGIEEIAESYNLEENLAVVTVSDYANVKQQLTNDYSRIRNVIENLVPEGRTPFFEAILVCLAALTNRKGRIVNVLGVHLIRPKILFFTDGKPTDESQISGQDSETGRMMHKLPIIKLVTDLGSKGSDAVADPIVWIPVGEADRDFLKSLATLGNGIIAGEEDIPKLCQFYKIQDGIGRVFSCVRQDRERYTNDAFSLEAVTEGLVPNLSPEEKKRIAEAVNEKLKSQKVEKKPNDFDDIHEDTSCFPPLGSRVIRGPDWKWNNQDSEGAGTVINHNTLDKWLWVKWDNGEQNVYRYGAEGAYDILVVDDHPLVPKADEIPIGVTVTRGPDWSYGNDDGGPGCSGVVIRKKGKTQVKVRWDSGSMKSYKYGENGIYELTVCDPSSSHPKGSVPDYLFETDMSMKTGTVRSKADDKMVWQWQDQQHQWRMYSDANQVKINQTYQRKKNGSCVVSRKGQNYRVLLGQLIERSIDGDSRHNIRQVGMSEEEFRLAKETEAFISM